MLGALTSAAQFVVNAFLGLYLLVSLLSLGRTTIAALRSNWPRAGREDAVITRLQRRARISALLIGITWRFAYVVAWPVTRPILNEYARLPSDIQRQANLDLKPLDRRLAAFSAVLIAVVLGLAALHVGSYLLELATVLAAIAATAARQLSYLVGPLLPRLRKARPDTEEYFLETVALDLLTQVLGIAALFEAPTKLQPSLTHLTQAAIHFVIPISQPEQYVAVYLLSALMWSVAIKSLFEAYSQSQFEPTDADNLGKALAYAQLGKYRRARGALGEVRQPSAESWLLGAVVEVGLGRYDTALDLAQRARNIRQEDQRIDSVVRPIWLYSASIPFEPATRLQFMLKEIDWGVGDATIASQIANSNTRNQIPPHDLVKGLIEHLDAQVYPIARALTLSVGDDLDGAISLLERARPSGEIEETMLLIYLPMYKTVRSFLEQLKGRGAPEEGAAILIDWRQRTFPTLRNYCLSLDPTWRRSVLSLLVYFRLLIARIPRLASPNSAEIQALDGSLSELINDLEERDGEVDEFTRLWH